MLLSITSVHLHNMCVYDICVTDGAVIKVTDEQPSSSTMSLVLTDIVGMRTYCTGLRFYRPFTVVEVRAELFNKFLCHLYCIHFIEW